MNVLVADDDPVARRILVARLTKLGYAVTAVETGTDALAALQREDGPRLALLDWMMPGLDGPDVCKRLRAARADHVHVVLVTAKRDPADVAAGLEAGADDFVSKPYDEGELRARLRAGERHVDLQMALATRVAELQDALDHVRRLQGLIPICMHCKSIRTGSDTWHRLETYITEHSEATFTHALCEKCLEKHYPEDAA